jgi:hypothetical protein
MVEGASGGDNADDMILDAVCLFACGGGGWCG